MVVFAIAAAVGAAMSIYGQVKAGQDQKEYADKQAALQRLQARELLSRQRINENLLRERGAELEKHYAGAFAASGKGGGGLGAILRARRDLEHNIVSSRREAEFKAKMIREGAQIEQELASDRLAASYIGAAGSLLKTGASFYNMYGKPGDAKDLPEA